MWQANKKCFIIIRVTHMRFENIKKQCNRKNSNKKQLSTIQYFFCWHILIPFPYDIYKAVEQTNHETLKIYKYLFARINSHYLFKKILICPSINNSSVLSIYLIASRIEIFDLQGKSKNNMK